MSEQTMQPEDASGEWTLKVKESIKLEGRETEQAERDELESTWVHERVCLRGLSVAYLIKFWEDIKTSGRHSDVIIYQIKGTGESYVKLEDFDDGEVTLASKAGTQKMVEKSQLQAKRHQDWTLDDIRHFCLSKILPRYGGHSFLDSLLPEQVSNPFECAYVVVPGEARFESLLESLYVRWASKEQEKQANQPSHFPGKGRRRKQVPGENFFVWLSIFCTSKAKPMDKQEEIEDICYKAIKLFDDRLVYLDDWRNPSIMTRAWCILEVYGVVTCMKPFEFIHDHTTGGKIYSVLEAKGTLGSDLIITWSKFHESFISDSVFSKIESIDPSKLISSDPSLIQNVRASLARLPNGFQSFIKVFKNRFCKVIAMQIDQDVFELFQAMDSAGFDEDKVRGASFLVGKAGVFMQKIGELEASSAYLAKALTLLEEASTTKSSDPRILNAKVFLYTHMAQSYLPKKKFAEAKLCLKSALEAAQEAQDDLVIKQIKLAYGEFQLARGTYDDALKIYLKILEEYKENALSLQQMEVKQYTLRKVRRGSAIRNLNAMRYLRQTEMADDSNSDKARSKRLEQVHWNMLKIEILVGKILSLKHRFTEAHFHFQQALTELEGEGKVDTIEYAEVLLDMGDIQATKKYHKKALEYYKRSIDAFGNIVGSSNPFVASLYRKISHCLAALNDRRSVEYWNRSETIFVELNGKPEAELSAISVTGRWKSDSTPSKTSD